jgi:hypothetical protein
LHALFDTLPCCESGFLPIAGIASKELDLIETS